MRRYCITLLLLLAPIGTVSAAAPPAASTYEIEVLVFENRLPDLEGNEQWTAGASKQEAVNPIALGATPATSDLAKAATALQNDPRYRLLAHRRWIQAADGRSARAGISTRNFQKALGVICRSLCGWLPSE